MVTWLAEYLVIVCNPIYSVGPVCWFLASFKSLQIGDMVELGISEAFKVKHAVLLSATEAAEMILRVDEIITCAPRRREDRMWNWVDPWLHKDICCDASHPGFEFSMLKFYFDIINCWTVLAFIICCAVKLLFSKLIAMQLGC